MVELGPRGTGKSYAVQEISPYGALLTGPTTVANLFGHMNGKQKGMVRSGTSWLRRGGRPPEDAQGGHHDAEDLLRVGHVPARQGGGRPATRASPCSATRTSRST